MKKLSIIVLGVLCTSLYAQEYMFTVKKETYQNRLKVDESLVCELPFEKINNQCVLNCPEGTNPNEFGNACLYPAINGICGSDNNQITITGSQPSNLCSTGNVINFSNNASTFNWSCEGIKNDSTKFEGADVSCLTYKEAICDNNYGGCVLGDSNYTSSIGATNVTWNCTNGLSIKNCSKPAEIGISGVCGTSNGVITTVSPTNNLCTSGAASAISNVNGEFLWTCQGEVATQTKTAGSTANCKTQKPPILTYTVTYSGVFGNYNNTTTLANATDRNINTMSAYWYVANTNSNATIRFTPDQKLTNRKVTLYWNDLVYNGYGNQMYIAVQVVDNGVLKTIYSGNIWTPQTGTNRQISYNFERLDDVRFYIYDIGRGAPHIAIRDIIIE